MQKTRPGIRTKSVPVEVEKVLVHPLPVRYLLERRCLVGLERAAAAEGFVRVAARLPYFEVAGGAFALVLGSQHS